MIASTGVQLQQMRLGVKLVLNDRLHGAWPGHAVGRSPAQGMQTAFETSRQTRRVSVTGGRSEKATRLPEEGLQPAKSSGEGSEPHSRLRHHIEQG